MESYRICRNRKNAEIANAKANAVEEEDILGNKLPESVITHILSFLPTKDAIRTSILSKTWEHRWTSITKLSLHDHHQHSSSNFVRFVDRALLLTDGLTMDHFSLLLFDRYESSLLDTWFSNIFNRRVINLQIESYFPLSLSLSKNSMLLQELELLTNLISIIKLPIFMSFEELELLTNSISLNNVPTPIKSFCFENLKLLKLCGINFQNDSPKSSCSILLSFPLLTKFEAKNCSWFVGESDVFITAPLLQSISIRHDIHVDVNYSCITFCDSLHLKEITYSSYGSYGIRQDMLIRSSCHASPKFILYAGNFMLDCYIFRILSQFSHAKSIQFEASKVLLQPQKLCVFPMLTHLEVGLVSVDILLALLQTTPVLKTLVLKGIRKFVEELLSSAVVPECLASLHVVKFEEVNGEDHELFLAKFFMENGMILERTCFSFDSQILGKYEVMEKFKGKLYSFHNFNSVVEFKEN